MFSAEHRPTSEDPVAKAVRSASADPKARTKRTSDGNPARSYHMLLSELATQTRNRTRLQGQDSPFETPTQATALQARAHDLAANAPVVNK